jgi:pimeloyl-ACP methyl ester carboxylesterase
VTRDHDPSTVGDLGTGSHRLRHAVVVDGAMIRYDARGTGPGDVLLVHGHSAHHMWWHLVAPELERTHRVIRMDLSGHGDSDHRDDYSPAIRVRELVAVLDAVGADRPVIVGHSMGGRLAVVAGAERPDRIAGLVLLDTSIRPPGEQIPPSTRAGVRGLTYPTREDALARFRLKPPQPHPPAEVLAPVADYSLRDVGGGWAWKHDQRGYLGVDDAFTHDCAERLQLPVAYLYGEQSDIVDQPMAAYVRTVVPGPVRVTAVTNAAHHVPLDAPAETARLVEQSVAWILAETQRDVG